MLYVMVAAAAFATPAEAIYKCTTAKGGVYQDRPCREGNESGVQIVIPTGDVAPKFAATHDDDAQANGAKPDARSGTQKSARGAADEQAAAVNPADKRPNVAGANATDDGRKKDARSAAESSSASVTAEQARKSDPSAKYYTTDAFSSGAQTPEHMTCESPTGEKRTFLLTNGKLTSI